MTGLGLGDFSWGLGMTTRWDWGNTGHIESTLLVTGWVTSKSLYLSGPPFPRVCVGVIKKLTSWVEMT